MMWHASSQLKGERLIITHELISTMDRLMVSLTNSALTF
jgi:hypothetical protein